MVEHARGKMVESAPQRCTSVHRLQPAAGASGTTRAPPSHGVPQLPRTLAEAGCEGGAASGGQGSASRPGLNTIVKNCTQRAARCPPLPHQRQSRGTPRESARGLSGAPAFPRQRRRPAAVKMLWPPVSGGCSDQSEAKLRHQTRDLSSFVLEPNGYGGLPGVSDPGS